MELPELIISRAHEVVQSLPLSARLYTCMQCHTIGSLAKLFSDYPDEKCTPHFETKTSGWLDEFELIARAL